MDTRQLVVTIGSILVGVVAVVALLIYMARPQVSEEYPLLETQYTGYSASAGVHAGRYGSYEGLCDDISVPDNVSCVADDDEFVLFEPLPLEGFYCTDSLGFRGPVPTVSTGIRCQL